ncbi:MAG: NAD(+)/NADH kinase [Chitinophagaceae bacterium]
MKVAIYSREGSALVPQDLQQLCDALSEAGIEAIVYYQLPLDNFKSHKTFSDESELDQSFDAVISLGGDGTLLDTVCLVRDKQIPVLGINYGRLGFLASLRKEDLQEAVDALKNNTYVLVKRSLVHLDASVQLFGRDPFAFN